MADYFRVALGTFFVAVAVAIETPCRSCEYEVCSQSSVHSSIYLRSLCDFAASAVPSRTPAYPLYNSAARIRQLEMLAIPVAMESNFSTAELRWERNEPAAPFKMRMLLDTKDVMVDNVKTRWNSTTLEGRRRSFKGLYQQQLTAGDSIQNVLIYHQDVWKKVSSIHRHDFHEHPSKLKGVSGFLTSVKFFEWGLFLVTTVICVFLSKGMLHFNSLRARQRVSFHVAVLIMWIVIGVAYNRMVWWRLGRNEGLAWTSGYLLEMIFSIENVFVFSSIIDAFKVPQRSAQKAIFAVVCCQILFQMVLIMGLASWLRSLQFLPYALGAWIVYVGWCVSQTHSDTDFDIVEALPIKLLKSLFGDSFVLTYDEAGSIWIREPARGRAQITLLAAAILSLVMADFCLEVDVTLSKVEEIPTQYISFTSSAIAAFMVPELYLVVKSLATRYSELRYGISFALVFFGAQMIFHKVFTIPDIAGCSIMIGAMVISILYAEIDRFLRSEGKSHDSGAHSASDTDSTGGGSLDTPPEIVLESAASAASMPKVSSAAASAAASDATLSKVSSVASMQASGSVASMQASGSNQAGQPEKQAASQGCDATALH